MTDSNEAKLIGNILQDDYDNSGSEEEEAVAEQPQKIAYGLHPSMLKRADSAPPQDNELKFGAESPSHKPQRTFDTGSYAYYQYYHSLKPKDPRLPKPTYKPYEGVWKFNATPGKLPVHKIEEERNEQDEKERIGVNGAVFLGAGNGRIKEESGSYDINKGFDFIQQKIGSLNLNSEMNMPPQNISMVQPPQFLKKASIDDRQNTHDSQGHLFSRGSQKSLIQTSSSSQGPWNHAQGSSSNLFEAQPQFVPPQQTPQNMFAGFGPIPPPIGIRNAFGGPPVKDMYQQKSPFMGGMQPQPEFQKQSSYNRLLSFEQQQTPGYMPMDPMRPLYQQGPPPMFKNMGYQPPPWQAQSYEDPQFKSQYMPQHFNQGFQPPMHPQNMMYNSPPQQMYYPNQGHYHPQQNPGFISPPSQGPVVAQQPPKTAFLEELRQKLMYNKKVDLRELEGHVVEAALDQHGSRLLQQRFEIASKEEKQLVFCELLPECNKLIVDVFGNYVMQKVFEFGTEEMRSSLADQLLGQVYTLSTHMYGCRVVQKALEYANLDLRKLLVSELKDHVILCIEDQNANHVIQKCIEKTSPDAVQFIVDAIKENTFQMCIHAYGCRVIQRLLEYCSEEQVQPVTDQIMKKTVPLSKDQYGNYVIQHILEQGKPGQRDAVINSLRGRVLEMSTQKFASNVVEKSLMYANADQREFLIDEIGGLTSGNDIVLFSLIKDRYGNYVVQKAMEVGSQEQKNQLITKIQINSAAIQKFGNYARHVFTFLEKLEGFKTQ